MDGTLNKCIVELEKLEKLTTKNKDSLILLIAMYKKVYEITKHRFNNPSDPEKTSAISIFNYIYKKNDLQ